MARRYSASARNIAGATAGAHLINVTGTAAARVIGQEFDVGMYVTSGTVILDNASSFSFQRHSAILTAGTTIVPAAMDQGTTAAICTSTASPTGGTLVTPGIQVPLNMRATWRWIAQPGWELICSSGTGNGIVLRVDAQNTQFSLDATVLFEE